MLLASEAISILIPDSRSDCGRHSGCGRQARTKKNEALLHSQAIVESFAITSIYIIDEIRAWKCLRHLAFRALRV